MSSIRYKFRSSVNFDTLLIGGQLSLSVAEFRAQILRIKNLDLSQGFILLFSDSHSGLEYKEDGDRIPSGSSVIVKRVPAPTVPSTTAPVSIDNKLMIDSSLAIPGSISLPVEVDLDDYAVDLCPIFKTAPDHSFWFDKHNCGGNDKLSNAYLRIGTEKLELCNGSEMASRDVDEVATEKKLIVPVELKGREDIKHKKMDGVHCPALQNVHLSSELKCSLCKSYFEEAVMIPCCQHSFCQKCISNTLIRKGTCPKCKSSQCKVADLIPNLSLSRAINKFLESTVRSSDEYKPLHRDASDGESGNQIKDHTSAIPKRESELKMPVSHSATEIGSNHIMREPVYDSQINYVSDSRVCNFGAEELFNSALSCHKLRQIDGKKVSLAHGFEEENPPQNIRQRPITEKGGDNMYMGIRRHNKGDRTCNMCGSPDHFIRYCPLASNRLPIPPTGIPMFPGAMPIYGSPFWNGITVAAPAMRPFNNNMYGNSGMMHFNPFLIPPASPYAIPPYMLSMYGDGQQGPSGVMSSIGPQQRAASKYSVHPSEFLELQNSEKRPRISNESLRRRRPYQYDDNERLRTTDAEISHKYKHRVEREQSLSYFEDSFTERSEKKNKEDYHQRDRHTVYVSNRSNPRPCKLRSSPKVKDLSQPTYVDQKKHKGIDPNYVTRQLRGDAKPTSNSLVNDRWKMSCGSDDDGREHHHYLRRKRVN